MNLKNGENESTKWNLVCSCGSCDRGVREVPAALEVHGLELQAPGELAARPAVTGIWRGFD